MNHVVLVTGGAGFIGSHTCKALRLAGYSPVVYDNLSVGHAWAVRWGPLEIGDIGDRQRLDQVLAHYRPEVVVHFAGSAYVGESVENPSKYYRNNVAGSLTLLETLHDHGIRRLVFSSSCATYGLPSRLPMDEQHDQHPINPYGRSKLMVEHMLQDFVYTHDFRVVSLRYFNAAGAEPEAGLGEDHDPETHLIPLALQAALGQRPALTIFGDDYPTTDGTCIRDYIHVSDLAQAHVLALARMQPDPGFRAYNVGTTRGASIREVLTVVEEVTGCTVPHRIGPRRPGDPPVLVADTRLIGQELGWQARFPDLRQMIHSAWQWIQQPQRHRDVAVPSSVEQR